MSCEHYRSALTEVALGAPAPPAFEAHLAECAPCSAALAEQRRLLGKIDREIQAALGTTPSAELLPRVRQRVAEQGRAAQRRLARRLLAAAVVVGMAVVGERFMRRQAVVPPSTLKRAAVEEPRAQPAPRVEPRPPSPQAAPPAAVQVTRAPLPRRAEPEVLVPPGEEAALRGLAEAIRHERVDPTSFLAVGFEPAGPEDVRVDPPSLLAVRLHPAEPEHTGVRPIHVKPLAMEPITRSES